MQVSIPEKVYVGFQGRRTQDEVPLGYMTPYTDDAAGQTRQASVDKWAKGYGGNKSFNSIIINNKPMYGFRLGRAIRRSGHFGSGASYVRIEDPRGFELEISIENLVAVLETCAMERCEFVGELVWARVPGSSKNLLVAVDSDLYRGSIKTKAATAAAKSSKEFKIGDTIEAVTGETGVYMGMLVGVVDGWKEPEPMASKKPVLRVTDEDGDVTYLGFVDLKGTVTKEHEGDALTAQDSENEIVAAMQDNQFICGYKGNSKIIAWFAKKPVIHAIRELKTQEQLHKLFDTDRSSYSYFYCFLNRTEYSIHRTDKGAFEASTRVYHYGSSAATVTWDKFELSGHSFSNGDNTVNFF